MVPTIVIAHTFLHISRYLGFLTVMLTNTVTFLRGLKLSREVDLIITKYSWYPKRKLGVTMHFSEIIKLQLYFKAFYKYYSPIIKNALLPPIFFLDVKNTC